MKSWLDVLDALYAESWSRELRRFRSPYAFRGHSLVNHTLSSSLVRLSQPGGDPRRLEVALLRNFRKYAHGEAVRADSIWDWLALGQHRGLPTRLLDWTYSPLVALHFATHDPSEFDKDGVVWCVNFVEANKRLPRRLRTILEQEGIGYADRGNAQRLPIASGVRRAVAHPFRGLPRAARRRHADTQPARSLLTDVEPEAVSTTGCAVIRNSAAVC